MRLEPQVSFFTLSIFFFCNLQLIHVDTRTAYGTRVRDEDASTGARDTSDTSRAPRYVFSFSYLSSLFNLLMRFYYRLHVTTTKGKSTDEDGTGTGTRKGPKRRNEVSSFVP